MENESDQHTPHDAATALQMLHSDREQLADLAQVPRPLLAAYGGVGAWFVAAAASTSPGAGYEPPQSTWLALVAVLVISYLVQRETGVRFRSMGAGAAGATVGILILCLGLYSVSLGLVSLGAVWAVTFTSLLAFGGTTLLADAAYRSAFRKLGRG